MLKRLLLLWIFSGFLDSFSQVNADSLLKRCDALIAKCKRMATEMDEYEKKNLQDIRPAPKPDTLRAICLVTLFPNGIAHARMGYVVVTEGKETQYLDCRKNALKLPQVGWGYRIVNPNNQK